MRPATCWRAPSVPFRGLFWIRRCKAVRSTDTPGTDPVHVRFLGIRKAIEGRRVLRGVDLDVARGCVNFIVGGSGEGKSLLLALLAGRLPPDGGRILVDGVEVCAPQPSTVRPGMALLEQHTSLDPARTVLENAGRGGGVERAREVLVRLGFGEGDLGKLPAELPLGMQRCAALTCALAAETELLVCDEPTTGLDPITARRVEESIAGASARRGTTALIASFDLPMAWRIGCRISVLRDGRIAACGTPKEILSEGGAGFAGPERPSKSPAR